MAAQSKVPKKVSLYFSFIEKYLNLVNHMLYTRGSQTFQHPSALHYNGNPPTLGHSTLNLRGRGSAEAPAENATGGVWR